MHAFYLVNSKNGKKNRTVILRFYVEKRAKKSAGCSNFKR